MPQIAKVAVSAANYAIDKPYDYLLPDGTDAAVGSRVLVPFGRGNRLTEGMILSLERKTPEKALKAVREVLEPEPVCSEREIRLALWMRQRYFCTFYDAIRTILPAGVWYRYRQFWKLADYAGEDALSEKEKPLYALLSRGEQELETLAQAVPDAAALLRQMEKKGLVTSRTEGSRRVGDRVVKLASLAIEPEEGIERFRYLVASRADFDYTAFEGEASVRRMIIGHWDDLTNESTKAITVNATGLKPNTEYQVGIVGFDKELREKVLLYDFTTGEPTGPKPTLAVETQTVETPWNKAAFKVNATYAVAMTAGVFPKGSIDEVLGRPGNENLTAGDVIYNNGTQLTEQEVAAAMSEEGLVIESGELLPNTEYEFGVYAANAEGVGVSEIVEFTTLLPPQQGGELRAKLPGKYTATTKDSNGDPVTFSVTIATGVNEATEKAYSDLNRLVVLGFAPCGVDYASPEELLANGWAATEEEANANYGPKWFIEFNSDETISTSLPVNDELDYTMLNFDGKQYYFHAFAKRPTSDRYTDAVRSFPVEVSDDLTVTIKKLVEETDYGTFTYYPGVLSGTSQWWGDMVFAASEEIVLKRDADQGPEPAAVKSVRHLSMPERVTVNLGASPAVDNRRAVAERLMR